MKITGIEITRKSRKMSKEELQEHMKNSRQGVGIQRNKKKYRIVVRVLEFKEIKRNILVNKNINSDNY